MYHVSHFNFMTLIFVEKRKMKKMIFAGIRGAQGERQKKNSLQCICCDDKENFPLKPHLLFSN